MHQDILVETQWPRPGWVSHSVPIRRWAEVLWRWVFGCAPIFRCASILSLIQSGQLCFPGQNLFLC